MAGFKYKRDKNFNEYNDWFEQNCIGKQYQFAWLPQTCHLSGKQIWLRQGIKRTAMFRRGDRNEFDQRWYDKEEYLILTLRC